MKQDNNDNEKKELFEQAQKASMQKLVERQKEVVSTSQKDKVAIAVKERLEEGETQWDLMKKMLEGSLTEKFINVMHEMNDAQFVRTYLKLLEYIKPKITRVEGGGEAENDITVNIQTLIVNEKGEKEVVPMNQLTENKNGD